ncbi:MAG: 50S ribosomal protein L32 [Solitalea-like symbiont of Acarus siro]
MPNPKRRHSKSRTRSRKANFKSVAPTLSICKKTGTIHERHHAYEVDGNLFYKGEMFIEKQS